MRLSREAVLGRQYFGTLILLVLVAFSLVSVPHAEGFFTAFGDAVASVLGLWAAFTLVFVGPAVAAFEGGRIPPEEGERLLVRASFVPFFGYLAYRRYVSRARTDGG